MAHEIIGHVNIELSSNVLEIPDDAYTTLSITLNGCSTLLQVDWLILENNQKANFEP